MNYDVDKLHKGYVGDFVIQNHLAQNRHWDFRLLFPVTSLKDSLGKYVQNRHWDKTNEPKVKAEDKSGLVYRSWAIPKHKKPTDKPVLATETEDHVKEYGKFEGVIPEGYGAGKVEIYDSGKYTLVDVEYDKKYVFYLNGKKIQGYFALIKSDGDKFLWIKVKNTDDYKDIKIASNCLKKIAKYIFRI